MASETMMARRSDLTLYDLFSARFVGMDEKQVRALISYDERVRNPDERFELDINDFKSWQAARVRFNQELELMGVNERLEPICFAYYIELSRSKGHYHTRKLWQLLYAAYDRDLFQETCMRMHYYNILLKCFSDLSDKWLDRVMHACHARMGDDGAGNGYFWMAFELAQKLDHYPMLKILTRMALDKGEIKLAEEVAQHLGRRLDGSQKARVARALFRRVAKDASHVRGDDLKLLVEHRKLGYGPRLIRKLIAKAGQSGYSQIEIGEALYLAEQFRYRFTDRELKSMWLTASCKDDHFGDLKLRVLRLLTKRDKSFVPEYNEILRKTLAYETRGSSVESMRKTAEELQHELTSRDWFDRFLRNDHSKSETLELLAQSIVAETNRNTFIHPTRVTEQFLLETH